MLTMTHIKDIRDAYFLEGKNISQISRETGCDWDTIKKYIEQEDWNKPVTEFLKPEFLKLDPFKAEIDNWLIEDKKAKKKQRHSAQRVFNRLVKIHGGKFNCSYRMVAYYVSAKKKEIYTRQVGYLPLVHIPGEAQVDFGDAEYYEKGKRYDGKYLNLSFPNSNKGHLQLGKGENQECLFEGLINIFIHIGGVPTRMWFDNPSTMVVNVLKNGERKLTDDFRRFVEHHGFEAAFCNIQAGNEKGNVEGKVGYHRRNMLVPVPRFNDLAEYNKELFAECEEDAKRQHYKKDGTHEDLYQEDKAVLLPLPKNPFDSSKYETVKTNGYGKFLLNKGLHEYSASPKYAGTKILVKVTANEVIPLDNCQREIVRHERLYGNTKQESMKWLPYLTQLSRHPGALKYSGIYKMLPGTVTDFLNKCNKSEIGKVLSTIAYLTEKSCFENAVQTVETALSYQSTDEDSLIALHQRIHSNVKELPPIRLQSNLPTIDSVGVNLSIYDAKLARAGEVKC